MEWEIYGKQWSEFVKFKSSEVRLAGFESIIQYYLDCDYGYLVSPRLNSVKWGNNITHGDNGKVKWVDEKIKCFKDWHTTRHIICL